MDCKHHNNGSLNAFVAGFRAVTGREPEQYIDYKGCCVTLSEYAGATLDVKQLQECRKVGERHGQQSVRNAAQWKKVALLAEECEVIVREHMSTLFDAWMEWHDGDVYGTAITCSMESAECFAKQRLSYISEIFGLDLKLFQRIERELWFAHMGREVSQGACACSRCLDARNVLFPEKHTAWKRTAEESRWQAFSREIRRHFPCLPDKQLAQVMQRTIQAKAPVEPVGEAVCKAVQLHALWNSGYEAYRFGFGNPDLALAEAQPEIDALLAEWRGQKVKCSTNTDDGRATQLLEVTATNIQAPTATGSEPKGTA